MSRDLWRYWLALRAVRGIGPVAYQGLLRAFGEPAAVFAASAHALDCANVRVDLAQAIRSFDAWTSVERQLERLARVGGRVITWTDDEYPRHLREIHDPPPFLFVRGAFDPRDAVAVAVVGSRTVSPHGLRMARELTEGLVAAGVTVVSGLARGTDAQAHWTALRAGGRTVAVLGSGIDVIYPSEHHALSRKISEQGAVVTELSMGAKPDAENFPARNRIISGMTLGTVIVEATEKSGSLITAMCAAEQGREVFAVPGPVGEGTRGTHRLIRQGAKLTERVEDVLEELAPQLRRPVPAARPLAPAVRLSPAEAAVLGCLGGESLHVDEIVRRTALSVAVVLETLLGLELGGRIRQLPGMQVVTTRVDASGGPAKE